MNCKICGRQICWDKDRSYDYCAEHKEVGLRKEHEREVERYKSLFEWNSTIPADDEVVCPHCFHIERDWEALPGLEEDGEETDDYCCCNCEKVFSVSLSVTRTFTSRQKKEEESS